MLNLNVTTIEHDESWSDLIKEKIKDKEIVDKWNLFTIKPDLKIENDCDGENPLYFKKYLDKIYDLPNFDIIVVDGRARAECIKRAIYKLNDNGILIVDNAERIEYESDINKIPKN